MQAPFSGSETKLRRAISHMFELEGEIAAFIATDPVSITAAIIDNGVAVRMDHKGVPEIIGAIVGDVIHNLRSSLDLAACDLVRLQGENADRVYFPFCNDKKDLGEMIRRRNFHKAGPQATALLRELRSYRNGNAALRAIHDLDIQDKHQSLIPGVMTFASPAFKLHDADGTPNIEIVGDPSAVYELRLIFPDDSALARQELVPTLHELVQLVTGIVEAFRSLPTG
jgi:hypothetical protein